MKALILSANNFEDLQLLVPFYRFQEAGYGVDIAAAENGSISGKHGYRVLVDKIFVDVNPADYAVLILPGGKAPAEIRDKPSVQTIVNAFFNTDKPVGAICHGPKILVSAGRLNGRRATCCRTVAKYIQDAGAEYLDREVVVDGKLVTSRQPDDLPAFLRELMRLVPAKSAMLPHPEASCSSSFPASP